MRAQSGGSVEVNGHAKEEKSESRDDLKQQGNIRKQQLQLQLLFNKM